MKNQEEPEVVSCLRQYHPPLLTPRDCQVIESRTRVAVRSQSGHKLWHLYTKERHARGMLADWDFVDLIPARKGTTSEAQATKWVVDGKWGEP